MLAYFVSLALLTLSLLSDVPDQEAVPSASPLRVRSVVFAGSTSFDERTLLSHMAWTRVGGEYLPRKLEADIETNLKAFLKEHGFMTCVVQWKADTDLRGEVDERPGFRRFPGQESFRLSPTEGRSYLAARVCRSLVRARRPTDRASFAKASAAKSVATKAIQAISEEPQDGDWARHAATRRAGLPTITMSLGVDDAWLRHLDYYVLLVAQLTYEKSGNSARQNLSKLIELVKEGREILITDRGKPVARLVGPAQPTAAKFNDHSSFRAKMPVLDPPLSQTVSETRDDRI